MTKRSTDQPRIPQDADDLLRNWAAWAKVRPRQGHCRSIEHRYRAPAGEVMEGVQARAPEPDINLALRVEAQVILLPTIGRQALKFHYLPPVSPASGAWYGQQRKLCRELRISVLRLTEETYCAAILVRNRILTFLPDGV